MTSHGITKVQPRISGAWAGLGWSSTTRARRRRRQQRRHLRGRRPGGRRPSARRQRGGRGARGGSSRLPAREPFARGRGGSVGRMRTPRNTSRQVSPESPSAARMPHAYRRGKCFRLRAFDHASSAVAAVAAQNLGRKRESLGSPLPLRGRSASLVLQLDGCVAHAEVRGSTTLRSRRRRCLWPGYLRRGRHNGWIDQSVRPSVTHLMELRAAAQCRAFFG